MYSLTPVCICVHAVLSFLCIRSTYSLIYLPAVVEYLLGTLLFVLSFFFRYTVFVFGLGLFVRLFVCVFTIVAAPLHLLRFRLCLVLVLVFGFYFLVSSLRVEL